ncbi:MAG: hypothetical protein SNJ77_11095 [Cytophagales bacterium]
MKTILKYVLLLLTILLCGCFGSKLTSQHEKNNCNQQFLSEYSLGELPKPFHTLELDSILLSKFSKQSLFVANSIGIIDLLQAYVNLSKSYHQEQTLEKRIELIELTQKINHKINLSSLEISAIASEMNCEEERADQIAQFLKRKEDDTETKLTVSAIAFGAVGIVLTGILYSNGFSDNITEFVGISAGLIEAALWFSILTNTKKK